ncbi:MAG: nucleotidyltransferase domain-containing protein [Thermoplasmatota archaeon]
MPHPLPDEAKASVAKIIATYRPERIVLFGSYAYGTPTDDSDVDLLIIKKTRERPFDRALRVRRLLRSTQRRVPMDLIVMTPGEFDQRRSQGDAFLDLIEEQGIVIHGA